MYTPFDVIPDNGAPATAIVQCAGRFSWSAKYPINNDTIEGMIDQRGKIAVDPGWFLVSGSGIIYGCAKAGASAPTIATLKAELTACLAINAVDPLWLQFSAAPTANYWTMQVQTGAAGAAGSAVTTGLINWAFTQIVNNPTLAIDATSMAWLDDVTARYDNGANNAQAIAAWQWMQDQWSAWQP